MSFTLYPARNILAHAFEAALRFLYTDTVLGNDFFAQQHPPAEAQTIRVHNLDYIISYWVSGVELGLDPVATCAERLLSNYLDWDILELTYKHAIELANSPVSSHGKHMTGSDYLNASSNIIRVVLQFLAMYVNLKNFKLDTTSSSALVVPRLPQLDDGRPKHHPALSSMVFGSMPSSAPAGTSPSSSEPETQPFFSTFRDTVASHILLNVDFEHLHSFHTMIHATIKPHAEQIMTEIVAEREARRLKIYTSNIPNKDRMANSATWEAVGLRESISEYGLLSRERVGFLLSSK